MAGFPVHRPRPVPRTDGFTLIELLVVIAIIAVLASLLLPTLGRARSSARAMQCLGQLRQIGFAVRLYADDHDDELPRSQHSAFAHGQSPWGRAVAPQLGTSAVAWTNLLRHLYRCPSDRRPQPWSYGLNVYFELGPDDDYVGKPDTWRRVAQVPRPTATVLLAENASTADHHMAHFWSAPDDAEVPRSRHGNRPGFAFVDGHAGRHPLADTFDPPRSRDDWHPDLAR